MKSELTKRLLIFNQSVNLIPIFILLILENPPGIFRPAVLNVPAPSDTIKINFLFSSAGSGVCQSIHRSIHQIILQIISQIISEGFS